MISMENTPLYWSNPYQTEFEVTVLSVIEENEVAEITIDKPVARPASGGQAGDRGLLIGDTAEIQFFDTKLEGTQTVLIANQVPAVDKQYILVIDWNWRYSMMKNHTAEHLFVSQLLQRFPSVSVSQLWIDGKKANLTLQGSEIKHQDLLAAERRVQHLIEEGLEVTTELVESKEVDECIRAREGALEKHEKIRVVSIGSHDESACSGTHVRNTEEIKVFKIIDYASSNDRTEIEFLTDSSAIEELTKTYNLALARTEKVPFEMEQLGHILDKYSVLQANHEKMLEKIKSGIDHSVRIHTADDVSIYHDLLPGFDTKALREAALNLEPDEPALVLLFSPGETSYLVVRSVGLEEACVYMGDIVDSLEGKGGGRGEIYTGGFQSVEDPEKLYQELLIRVKETI